MSSASEAELGALVLNARKALPMRHTLIELGHAQPPTKIKTDNSTADGIVMVPSNQNQTVQKQWTRVSFGSAVALTRDSSKSIGPPVLTTSPTTLRSITALLTTNDFDLSISTRLQASVTCKGVFGRWARHQATSTSPLSAPPAAVSQPQQLPFHVALTRLTRAATRATRQQPCSLTAMFTSSLRAHNIC